MVVPAGGGFGASACGRGKCSTLSESGLLRIAAYRRRRAASHGAGACGFSSAGNFDRAEASCRLKHRPFHSLRTAWRRFSLFPCATCANWAAHGRARHDGPQDGLGTLIGLRYGIISAEGIGVTDAVLRATRCRPRPVLQESMHRPDHDGRSAGHTDVSIDRTNRGTRYRLKPFPAWWASLLGV